MSANANYNVRSEKFNNMTHITEDATTRLEEKPKHLSVTLLRKKARMGDLRMKNTELKATPKTSSIPSYRLGVLGSQMVVEKETDSKSSKRQVSKSGKDKDEANKEHVTMDAGNQLEQLEDDVALLQQEFNDHTRRLDGVEEQTSSLATGLFQIQSTMYQGITGRAGTSRISKVYSVLFLVMKDPQMSLATRVAGFAAMNDVLEAL